MASELTLSLSASIFNIAEINRVENTKIAAANIPR